MENIYRVVNFFDGVKAELLKLVVERLCRYRLLNRSAEILVVHRNRAVYKVAEGVCKVRVKALNNRIVGDGTVVCERHFA